VDYWKKQRDLYKYIHDQSVNLMNKGYPGPEIAEMIKLPPELDQQWDNRGYYGAEAPEFGPDWQPRAQAQFLFPR
jgi:alkyl sulfatase BDS1-like metallo-beta-lactamase superfamily hydrolase